MTTDNTGTGSSGAAPRIVVGVDGSEQSAQALGWAAQIARAYGAHLQVVSAWHWPTSSGWAAIPVDWNPRQDMEKCMTETVDRVFGSERPPGLELGATEGNPAQVLIEASTDALMLVVGSRGHGGFTGLLLGSVSSVVAEHSHCPVLVVHGDRLPPEVTS